jgi:hypothetical protein
MFRDEPTETLIRHQYATQSENLRRVAENLFRKQSSSVYAATALPGLLQKIDDGARLFELAFDDRFPEAIKGPVGRQNIRYARLKAAVQHAARKAEFGKLVRLLVELSTLAAVNERGADYLIDNPDLVVASRDFDAMRRLLSIRTKWPGTRHARLSIASLLAGDFGDAIRHAAIAEEWIRHFYRQSQEYRIDHGGPETVDVAAVVVCLVAQNRSSDAGRFMGAWRDQYAYQVCENVHYLIGRCVAAGIMSESLLWRFVTASQGQLGTLVGALAFSPFGRVRRSRLILQVARACEERRAAQSDQLSRQEDWSLHAGLQKAAAMAVAMGMKSEARAIMSTAVSKRPTLSDYESRFSNRDAFDFILATCIEISARGDPIGERDILPLELVDLSARIPIDTGTDGFRRALRTEVASAQDERISHEIRRSAERFIDERLERISKPRCEDRV